LADTRHTPKEVVQDNCGILTNPLGTIAPSLVGLMLAWPFPGPLFAKITLSVLGILGLVYYLVSYYLQAVQRPDQV